MTGAYFAYIFRIATSTSIQILENMSGNAISTIRRIKLARENKITWFKQ
jgi:hypothetical protein